MTQEEKTLIEAALAAQNPQAALSCTCRDILLERIRDKNYADRTMRYMVEDVIKTSHFGFPIEARVEHPHCGKVRISPARLLAALLVCLLGIVGIMAVDGAALRALCTAAATLGAFALAYTLYAETNTKAAPSPRVRVRCTASVEEIGDVLDKYTAALAAIFDYKQLETTHLDFLVWLQKQYCDIDDEVFRSSLVRLLRRFGYTLEAYADDKADCFDVSESNVTEPVTSVPAVFSGKGKVLLRGHYVLPLKHR